jgi:hypothetical protein
MTDVPTDLTGIPVQYQVYIMCGIAVARFLSQWASSVRKGGGLRHGLLSIWFGENVPPVIAKDYHKELFPNKHTPNE